MSRLSRCSQTILTILASALSVHGQTNEISRLREEIQNEQRALEEQSRRLNQLIQRLETLERQQPAQPIAQNPQPAAQSPPTRPTLAPPRPAPSSDRDSVGDLNAAKVLAGDFPGSIQIPGKDVSIALGGFVKTVGFRDTHSEGRDTTFMPAKLGEDRDDQDGDTVLSAELSRINIDARATAGESKLRGYIDFDFSDGEDHLRLRHAFLTWDHPKWGQLLAGKTWTTFMDTEALPEVITEPTLSGTIFARQVQVRYSHSLSRNLKFSASLEDSDSNDVTEPLVFQTHTGWPDSIFTLLWSGERSHFKTGALWRRYTIDPDDRDNLSVDGWGVQASGRIELGSRDKLSAIAVYGKGLGRYLLGILPDDGASVNLVTRSLQARTNGGGVLSFYHRWNSSCRSTAATGYAFAPTTPLEPDDALRSTIYGTANYMCSVSKYITIGGEYDYGRRWNKAGSFDDQRFMLGVQIF